MQQTLSPPILPYNSTPLPRSARPLFFLTTLLLSLYILMAACCEYSAQTLGRLTTGSWNRHHPLITLRTEFADGHIAATMLALDFINLILVATRLLLTTRPPYTARQAILAIPAAMLPLLADLLLNSFYGLGPAFE
ncbi:MAG: hypothetical protein ACTHN5_14295 [Phycisphaerae bacterium]